MKKEFKVLGMSVEVLTLVTGFFLVIWATIVSLISQSDSITSWIPAFFGIALILFSSLAIINSSAKKLWMHLVVMVAFIIFLGGLDFFRPIFNDDDLFSNFYAGISKLMLFFVGATLTYICVKSFIWARKNK
ncbi:MAG: hypothetical protein CMO97_01255 [Woeseia sp.]|nr:hypothetical protein [Woeseia sp.]|tara:strand:+ start:1830 stop:2225 length:396 start_codon:yes stop_codon:yes gene_type:complete